MNQGVHTVDLLLWLLGRAGRGVRAHRRRSPTSGSRSRTSRSPPSGSPPARSRCCTRPRPRTRAWRSGCRCTAPQGSAIIHDDQLEYFHVAGGPDRRDVTARPGRRRGTGVRAPGRGQGAGRVRGRAPAPVRRHRRRDHDGRPPGVTVADALLALAVVKAIYLSAHLGRPIAVDAVLAGDFDDVLPRSSSGSSREVLGLHRLDARLDAGRGGRAPGRAGLGRRRVAGHRPGAGRSPGFWAGNRATWPLTGLEARTRRDRADDPRGRARDVGDRRLRAAAPTTPTSSGCSPRPPRSAPAGCA